MPSMTVDGYELGYAESGAGEPLVLVHGPLGDRATGRRRWRRSGKHYRVLALSMRHCWPGEGPTSTAGSPSTGMSPTWPAFIRGLGAGPVRLVGHSRGGHIAFP